MGTYLKLLLWMRNTKFQAILFVSLSGFFSIVFLELFFKNQIKTFTFIVAIFINVVLNLITFSNSNKLMKKNTLHKRCIFILISANIKYVLFNLIAHVRLSKISFLICLNYILVGNLDILFSFSNEKRRKLYSLREMNPFNIFLLIQFFLILLFNSVCFLAGILIILLLFNQIYKSILQMKSNKFYEVLDLIKFPISVVDKEIKELFSNKKFKKLFDSFDEDNSLQNFFENYREVSTNISLNINISQFISQITDNSDAKGNNKTKFLQKIKVYHDFRDSRKKNSITIVLQSLENGNLMIFFINAKRIGIKKYMRQQVSHNYEILGNFSTEIKTPFNGIWGVFSLLKEVVRKDLEKHFRIAENSSIFLLNSINCLTDISLINSKTFKLIPRPSKIHEMKKKIEDIFHDQSKENEVNLFFNLDELPEILYFDYDRIEQVLICSIESLFDSSYRGSTITINAELAKENFIHFLFKLNNHFESNLIKPGAVNNIISLQSSQAFGFPNSKQNFENINLKMTKKLIEGMGCKLSIIKYGNCGMDLSFSVKNEVIDSPFLSENQDLNLFIVDKNISQFKIQLKPTNYNIKRRTSIDNLGANTINKLQSIIRKESLKKTPVNNSYDKSNDNSDNIAKRSFQEKNENDENVSEENSAEGVSEYVTSSVLSHVFRKSSEFCTKEHLDHNRVQTLSFKQIHPSLNSPKDEKLIKILVVDDNTYNRWLLIQMVIKKFKFTIKEAKNGLEACQIAHKDRKSVV